MGKDDKENKFHTPNVGFKKTNTAISQSCERETEDGQIWELLGEMITSI